ncbi:hypothetical protein Hanom_Chr11g01062171 [Helianthus anomalus]
MMNEHLPMCLQSSCSTVKSKSIGEECCILINPSSRNYFDKIRAQPTIQTHNPFFFKNGQKCMKHIIIVPPVHNSCLHMFLTTDHFKRESGTA